MRRGSGVPTPCSAMYDSTTIPSIIVIITRVTLQTIIIISIHIIAGNNLVEKRVQQ